MAILTATALLGCGRIFKGKAAGERAIAHLHDQYNQGRVEEIWKDADPGLPLLKDALSLKKEMDSKP